MCVAEWKLTMLDDAVVLKDLRSALARALNVSTPTVNDIVLQRRGVSADMALRLSICLDTTQEFWLNLQSTYDLRKAEIERGDAIRDQVERLAHCA
jgi:addiction module HigA family antidote